MGIYRIEPGQSYHMGGKTGAMSISPSGINFPGANGGGAQQSMMASGVSPRVEAPNLQQFSYSQEAMAYPNWLRSMGENNAQQAFQSQVNNSISSGNAGKGYQRALMDRNNSRLGYMAQAGQAQLGAEQMAGNQVNAYNQQLLGLYGANIGQRGQDLNFYSQMYGMNRGGGGSGWSGGGGNWGGGGGGGSPSGGIYQGMGGVGPVSRSNNLSMGGSGPFAKQYGGMTNTQFVGGRAPLKGN